MDSSNLLIDLEALEPRVTQPIKGDAANDDIYSIKAAIASVHLRGGRSFQMTMALRPLENPALIN
jgi:hypothetical protein